MVDSAVKYKCEECELKEAVLYCSSCTIDQGGELNHGATCEQDVYFLHPFCTESVMADTTSYSLSSSEDPFLYCQECSDTSHKGRKCRHSLHTIVNIDEVSVII